MESAELKKMRRKQLLSTNCLLLALLIVYSLLISFLNITYSEFFLALGIIILIQAVNGLVKGESTKSFIPIFEQVARYEKQKMGNEWKKQRRMGHIWNLLLSALMFFQFYLNRDSTDSIFQLDLIFMLIMTFFVMGLVNISLFFHIRKIDNSNSYIDLKGYTWKSNLLGIIIGIVFAVVVMMVTIFYIVSTI